MKRLSLKFLLLGFVVTVFACASQNWTVAKFSEFNLCLDPAYEWKESRISELLGSYLAYVYLDYPYSIPGHESRILSVLVRPSEEGVDPKEETLPTSEKHFDVSLGLYVYELEDGAEVVLTPTESETLKNVFPRTFRATCLKALHRYCERSFQYGAIEGSYSFARESLKNWREWEAGLESFLREGLVRRCGN